jgi:hypothetical protein
MTWWFFERIAGQIPLSEMTIRLTYHDVSYRRFATRITFKVGAPPNYGVSSVVQRVESGSALSRFVVWIHGS